jgi:hypothetical protein
MKSDIQELLIKIENGKFDLLNLDARRLSKFEVVIETFNQKGIDIISAPSGFEHDEIIDIILHGFTLPWYAFKLGSSAKAQTNDSVKNFFFFLNLERDIYKKSTDHELTSIQLSPNCFAHWFEYLLVNETNYNVWKKTNELLKVFTKSLENKFGKVSKWPRNAKSAWEVLKSHTPTKPKHEKLPPLGHYLGIPASCFTNNELIMGLRYGVIWLLLKLSEQRKLFSSNSKISAQIQTLQGLSLSEINNYFVRYPERFNGEKKIESQKRELAELENSCWKVVQQDPLLTEWQFYTFPKLRPAIESNNFRSNNIFDAAVQSLLLARYVNADGSLRRRSKGHKPDPDWSPLKPYLGTAGRGSAIQTSCWWASDLLLHTNLEKLLMVWLLASERAQRAGIEQLTFDGIHFSNNERNLQISTTKLRRLKEGSSRNRNTTVETMIYSRHEPPFKIYQDWLRHEEHLSSFIKDFNTEKLFIPMSSNAVSGHIAIRNIYPTSMLPLELLAVEGTVWNKTFLEEAGQAAHKEARAFVAILKNRLDAKRKNPELILSLPISPIGQSLIVEQERNSNNNVVSAHAEAEVMGHDINTGKNIYKDGFRELEVEEIIEPVKHFARAIGDAKIKLALKIVDRFNEATGRIDLIELKNILGIDSAISDQKKMLAALDEKDMLTIAGEINYEGQTLIIQTDMTAALMIGYINHLEAEIPRLMTTHRENSFLRHLARLIYLHQTFNTFPSYLQLQGKKLALELKFPFPPLD